MQAKTDKTEENTPIMLCYLIPLLYITNSLDQNERMSFIQKQVGHKDLKTTSVYLAPSTENISEAYAKARQKEKQHTYGTTDSQS